MNNQSLLNENINIIYKFCNQYPINNMEQEDWIQHCYAKVFSVINKYNHKNKFSTFVYSVLHNERKRIMKHNNNKVTLFSLNNAVIRDDNNDRLFESIENKEYFYQLINNLNKKDREFILEILDYIKKNGSMLGYAKYLAEKHHVSHQRIDQKFQRIKKQLLEIGGMD